MTAAVASRRGNPANLRNGGERLYDWDEILRLWNEGSTAPEIAEEVGCVEVTVYRVLRANGIVKERPNFTEEEQRFIVMLLEDECPYTEVARTVGTTRAILEHRWPGYGIKGGPSEHLKYARARRDFERLVKRLGLDEREER